jgi:hypothetical protein
MRQAFSENIDVTPSKLGESYHLRLRIKPKHNCINFPTHIFILIAYCDQPEPLSVLFPLTPGSSAIVGNLYFDVQHLSFQVLQDLLKMLSPNVDASASTGAMGLND